MNNGGPAFPVIGDERMKEIHTGMTLRDYFAGQALRAILSHEKNTICLTAEAGAVNPEGISAMAYDCYVMADAMLKHREI